MKKSQQCQTKKAISAPKKNTVTLSAEVIADICEALKESIPLPKCELEYENQYTFLVAIVLSAQSTDKQVNKVTESLFAVIRTPREMAGLGFDGLCEYVRTIGLYRNKASNIIRMSEILCERGYADSTELPNDREFLESLPGVGRKSANVFMNSIYNMPVIAVDTHVKRLSNRLGLSTSSNVLKIEEDLMECIPDCYKDIIGHLLVLHGRYVCKAKSPECDRCCIKKMCNYVSAV